MTRVFLSYSRVDGQSALEYSNHLRSSGFEVWIDQRDIPVSVPWLDEIEAAISGSALLLLVDSEHWRRSENCRIESSLADTWGVPQLAVSPGTTPSVVIGRVTAALSERTPDDVMRTELFVRSGDWATRWRPREALVSGRSLRTYLRVAQRSQRAIPSVVAEFIGASSRRQRRIVALRRTGVLAAIVLVIGGMAGYSGFGLMNSGIDMAIVSMDESARYDALYAKSPYALPHYLSTIDGDGWMVDYQFSRVFSQILPAQVVAADLSEAKVGSPVQVGMMSALSPDGTLRAEVGDGSSVRIVETSTGTLRRLLLTEGRPTTMAWAPNGDRLAVGVNSEVELLDVAHGTRSEMLRGSSGVVLGIAVTDSAVNVLTDRQTLVTWPAPWAHVKARGVGWLMDVESIGSSGTSAVLDRAGSILLVDTASGAEQDRFETGISSPQVAVALATDTEGGRAAVITTPEGVGEPALVVIDLQSRDTRSMPIQGCSPSDVTFVSSTVLALACGDAGVGVMDTESGEFVASPLDVFVSSVAAFGSRIVAGTRLGALLELDDELRVIRDGSTRCAQTIGALRFTPSGSYLFHGGTALGNSACGLRGDFTGDDTRWDRVIFPDQLAHQSRAVDVSPNGALVAFGFADGTVRVYGTEFIQPVIQMRPFTGEVRGLAFSPDGDALMIATRDGDIAVEPVMVDVPSLQDKRERATDLIDLAVALSLYRR